MKTAIEFLKGLHPSDQVWGDGDYEYTEEQLCKFAEAYHKEKMEEGEPQLYVHDIRNKLGSVTAWIDLMTNPRLLAVKETPKVIDIKNDALEQAKKSINYLAKKEEIKELMKKAERVKEFIAWALLPSAAALLTNGLLALVVGAMNWVSPLDMFLMLTGLDMFLYQYYLIGGVVVGLAKVFVFPDKLEKINRL